MALIGINRPAGPKQKPSTLEKVAAGFSIAKDVLGMSLAVPEFLQQRDLAAASAARDARDEQRDVDAARLNQQEARGTFFDKFKPSEVIEGGQGKVEVRGPDGKGTGEFRIAEERQEALPEGGFVAIAPGSARPGVFVPRDDEANTAFKARKQAVSNALEQGLVFVERDNELVAVDPAMVEEGEKPIDSFQEFQLADDNIKRNMRQQGIVLSTDRFVTDQERKDRRERLGVIDDIESGFRKTADKLSEEIAGITRAPALLNANSTIAEFGLGRELAKGVFGESGRLTDQDVLQFIPGSLAGNLQKVKNFLLGSNAGALTPDQEAAIMRTISNIARAKRIQLASKAYDALTTARANSRLQDSDELDDYERKLESRYGGEEALREAKQIMRARKKLATTDPGAQLKFEGQDVSWEDLKKATDVMTNKWLRER